VSCVISSTGANFGREFNFCEKSSNTSDLNSKFPDASVGVGDLKAEEIDLIGSKLPPTFR
jgi:hypothetical protein